MLFPLETWEEARELLPSVTKGILEVDLSKEYGRGKRQRVPKPIFSPVSTVDGNQKKKKIPEEVEASVPSCNNSLETINWRTPTPPLSLTEEDISTMATVEGMRLKS